MHGDETKKLGQAVKQGNKERVLAHIENAWVELCKAYAIAKNNNCPQKAPIETLVADVSAFIWHEQGKPKANHAPELSESVVPRLQVDLDVKFVIGIEQPDFHVIQIFENQGQMSHDLVKKFRDRNAETYQIVFHDFYLGVLAISGDPANPDTFSLYTYAQSEDDWQRVRRSSEKEIDRIYKAFGVSSNIW